MNIINYALLSKVHEQKTLDENYLESMYQYYNIGMQKLNIERY